MVFGRKSYFKNVTEKFAGYGHWSVKEKWYTRNFDTHAINYFKEGKFLHVINNGDFGITSISADYDKF